MDAIASLVDFNAEITGGESSEVYEFNGAGMIESINIDMTWADVNSVEVGLQICYFVGTSPNGTCFEFGGYNITSGACEFLGNYSAFLPK